MSEPEFTAFVTDHASVVHGLVLLVTGDREVTDEIVDAAWPEVYRRWPVIAASRRVRAHALAPFVTRAVRYAETIRPEQEPVGATVLELRDELVVDASSIHAPAGVAERRPATPEEEALAPQDRAIRHAFDDLSPRERALVALSLVVGLDDRDLPWAMRWRPRRAATVMHRAVRDLVLTTVPVVLGESPADTMSRPRDEVARVLTTRAATAADATQTLERLGPRLATTRQRRPVPRPVVIAAGAGTLALALVISAVVVFNDDEVQPAPATVAADRPAAAAGMQLVGYRSIYTSVPSSWSHNQLECGRPVANTVVYPDATSACFGEVFLQAGIPPSSVTFGDLPTSAVPLGRLRVVNQVGEFGVYATTPVHREGLFHEIVLVPEANVQMIVRATDIHVMDDIVDSLEKVPQGYTVVPPCERLMLRVAIQQLNDAELGVKLIQASTLSDREREPPVTHQTVASGAIVEKGTVVGIGFPSMN